jgi:hypothetical protein
MEAAGQPRPDRLTLGDNDGLLVNQIPEIRVIVG